MLNSDIDVVKCCRIFASITTHIPANDLPNTWFNDDSKTESCFMRLPERVMKTAT